MTLEALVKHEVIYRNNWLNGYADTARDLARAKADGNLESYLGSIQGCIYLARVDFWYNTTINSKYLQGRQDAFLDAVGC